MADQGFANVQPFLLPLPRVGFQLHPDLRRCVCLFVIFEGGGSPHNLCVCLSMQRHNLIVYAMTHTNVKIFFMSAPHV